MALITAPRSAKAFARLPELLMVLGDQIDNRSLLKDLRLVDKAFRDAFTPAFYSELEVHLRSDNVLFTLPESSRLTHPITQHQLSVLKQKSGIRYVQRLCYTGPGFRELDHSYMAGLHDLLAHMPRLKELVLTQQLLSKELLEVITRSCPKLISFAAIHGDELSNDQRIKVPCLIEHLSPIKGLRSLMLAGLWGDLEAWKPAIIRTLLACPSLQELGLSMEDDHCLPPANGRQNKDGFYLYAFSDLCRGYAGSGGCPLMLKRLILGQGVGLRREDIDPLTEAGKKSATPSAESYISQLTDLIFLEDIHIENSCYFQSMQAWWSFTEDKTPNLRRLSAYQYTDEIAEFCTHCKPGYTEKLALTFFFLPNPHLAYPFPARFGKGGGQTIRVHHFRMFEEKFDTGNEWTEYHTLPSDKEVDIIVNRKVMQWSPLSGLFVRMFRCDTLDSNRLELQILLQVLTSLPKLQQLQITCGQLTWSRLLAGKLTTEPGIEGVLSLALRISEKLPILRYIKIGRIACRIERDSEDRVRCLLELDHHEQRQVERFRPPYPFWPHFAHTDNQNNDSSYTHWAFRTSSVIEADTEGAEADFLAGFENYGHMY